ncbi:hypothetical protein BS78_01G202700 [Paspalum vaginatum]|nr:hypothetical protein BS78_01G202700 [Paspalum vaginatum]
MAPASDPAKGPATASPARESPQAPRLLAEGNQDPGARSLSGIAVPCYATGTLAHILSDNVVHISFRWRLQSSNTRSLHLRIVTRTESSYKRMERSYWHTSHFWTFLYKKDQTWLGVFLVSLLLIIFFWVWCDDIFQNFIVIILPYTLVNSHMYHEHSFLEIMYTVWLYL